jgi:hypothetical protein
VTTGSYGSSSIPAYTSGLQGSWAYKNWNGSNGKYQAAPGSPLKWNDYTVEQESMTIQSCPYQFFCSRPGGGTDTNTGWTPPLYRRYPSDSSFNLTDNDVNRVLNRLLAAVKGHDFNLGVNVAQGKQTFDLCVGNLRKLGRSALALKRGDFATAARQLGASPRPTRLKPSDISGRWLELQYGWLPLVSDSYAAAKAYESITNGPRTSQFSASLVKSQKYNYTTSPTIMSATQSFELRRKYTFELREEMSIQRQLGLYDPLSIAWEIVPWSFVVDWFVPIGTYLENLNQIPLLNGRWMVSQAKGTKGGVEFEWLGGPSLYPYCGYHGYAHRYDTLRLKPRFSRNAALYTRTPLVMAPKVPAPRFQSFADAVNPRRFWNSISLAQQRFSGNGVGTSFVTIGGDLTTPSGRYKRP